MNERILELSQELEYFAYLVQEHEIRDENTLKYYIPKVDSSLNAATIYLHSIKDAKNPKTGSRLMGSRTDKELNDLKAIRDSIRSWLDKYPGKKVKEMTLEMLGKKTPVVIEKIEDIVGGITGDKKPLKKLC